MQWHALAAATWNLRIHNAIPVMPRESEKKAAATGGEHVRSKQTQRTHLTPIRISPESRWLVHCHNLILGFRSIVAELARVRESDPEVLPLRLHPTF